MKDDRHGLLEENATLFAHHHIKVDPGQQAYRIDKFLSKKLVHITRNKAQLAIRNDFILVNTQPTKANYKVQPGDDIQIVLPTPPQLKAIIPENIPLDILYEDSALIIVNKPAGMVVHPACSNWTGTLVNALRYHFEHLPAAEGNQNRSGLVHRIDKDTSGVLVVAKTEESMVALAKQFYDHTITRRYYALVWGIPATATGTIDVHVGRSPKDRRVMETFSNGKSGKNAITHYKVIKNLGYVALLECTLETGRTHQIRVHMQHIGHPIFNDERYGGSRIIQGSQFSKYKAFIQNCFALMPRQALHAQALGFVHPTTQQPIHFEVNLPNDFQALLKKWERYVQYTY